LTAVRIGAIANTAVAIAKALFTGKDPWDDILQAWNLPKESYHVMHRDTSEGDQGMMVDIGIIPVFP